MGKDWDPPSIFEVFGDETVRDILVLASEGPVSAESIAQHTETSLPTVYRRLDTLTELDLLREEMHVDSDGTQYRQFETALKGVNFEIVDGGFDIDIRLRQDVSSRFEAFWGELEEASHGEHDQHDQHDQHDITGDSDERPGSDPHYG